MSKPDFESYLASLSSLEPVAPLLDQETLEICGRATEAFQQASPLTSARLAVVLQNNPEFVPVVASIAGFSQERFKTWLIAKFDTGGLITILRERPDELVEALDVEVEIVELLNEQSHHRWTWAEVVATGMSQRHRAGYAIKKGRDLEDVVEAVIEGVGLPFSPRTRFLGRGNEVAPSDFAIPGDGSEAQIVVAVKEFHSTGSKLSDAAREIEEMANVRKPSQYVFAVVDGQGWKRRQSDLRKIFRLLEEDRIDGIFNKSTMPDFETELARAAKRLSLAE